MKPEIYSFYETIDGEPVRIVYEIEDTFYGEQLRDYCFYPQRPEWSEDVEELIYLHWKGWLNKSR